jgi:S1-C subfamily serine protease
MSIAARHLPVLTALISVALVGLIANRGLRSEPPRPTAEPPSREVPPEEPAAEELPAVESVPSWLGVVLEDGFAPLGVLIVDVAPRSPAEAAGLRPGDLIRRFADSTPRDALDVASLIGNHQAGDVITLTIRRGRVLVELTATLTATRDTHAVHAGAPLQSSAAPLLFPPDAAHWNDRATFAPPQAWLGVETAPVTNLARRVFHLPNNRGAVVNYVYAGSPAQRAGIMPGAVIRAIDSRQVTNPDDVARFIAEAGIGEQVEISLWADDGPVCRTVRLDAHPLETIP